MSSLVFFLEEPSAKEMLRAILPKIFDCGHEFYFIVFEGKSDLDKQIEKRLQGWNRPDSKFIVLRDRDSGDCYTIKHNLKQKCESAGKKDCLIRIACCEIESWYLGDLNAIEKGLNIRGIDTPKNQNKYSSPDVFNNASEELSKLTKNKYQKISGSRSISPHLDLSSNRSKSFNVFIKGLKKLL